MSVPPQALPSRTNDGWLAGPERRALDWFCLRLPAWVSPDHLTALGFLGAIAAFTGYVLSASDPTWLWLVNAGLAANWFGDSMDGNVARMRGIERPRYGFYLDQSIDVLSQFIFAFGLGLSGFVSFVVAITGLAAYLMMSVLSLLRATVTGEFRLAAGRIGLTEVRCFLFFGNILFFFFPPVPFEIGRNIVVYGDLLGVVWITVNLVQYLVSMIAELRRLANADRPPPRD
jgi:phosphatidylglycerophosphate synthase